VQHGARHAGETKYSLSKMFRLAFDGIASFSRMPLQIASWVGFAVSLFAFGWGGWLVAKKGIAMFPGMGHLDQAVTGWTSTMVVLLFLGGVQLLCLGVLGSYVGRIYGETQGRPLYIVAERLGGQRDD